MSLVDVVKKYQNKLLNKGILAEYGFFFDERVKKHCKFVIDDCEALEELHRVVLKLIEKDQNAEIYINTFSPVFANENTYIYADTLWIISTLDTEALYSLFKGHQNIEPSDIISLSENETIDGDIELAVWSDDQVRDYRSFIKTRPLDMIKSLYWD